MENTTRSSTREKPSSLKMLEGRLARLEETLVDLLKINVCSFTDNNCRMDHGKLVKTTYNSFYTASRDVSKYLLNNASLQASAEVTAHRNQKCSEVNELLKLINSLDNDNEFEDLSNVDWRSEVSNNDSISTTENSVANEDTSNILEGDEVNSPEDGQIRNSPSVAAINPPTSINYSVRRLSISSEPPSTHPLVQNHPEQTTAGSPLNYNAISFIPAKFRRPLAVPNIGGRNTLHNTQPPQHNVPFHHGSGTRPHPVFLPTSSHTHPIQENPPVTINAGSKPELSLNYTPLLSHNQPPADHLTTILAKQLLTKDLLTNAIEPFDGSSYKFWSWLQQIENRVKFLSLTPSEYVHVLESNSTGEPRRMINNFLSSCGSMDTEKLNQMSEILIETFGSSSKISQELLGKLKAFPVIKNASAMERSLRELLDLCRLIQFNMSGTPELQFLNIADGTDLVRFKLPNFIQDRWRTFGQKYEDKNHGQHPPFSEFISFLSYQIREVTNPNYKTATNINYQSYDRKPFKTLLTKASTSERFAPKANSKKFCFLHKTSDHGTAECRNFTKMPYEDKKKIIIENRLCYLCLLKHMMADCRSRVKCEKCHQNHVTAMHEDDKEEKRPRDNQKENIPKFKSMCTKRCNDSNMSRSCSKTLLVEVSLEEDPEKKLICYAIIDEQSDCTLVDPKVPAFFNKTFPVENYDLTTINGTSVSRQGMQVTGLSVRGVTEKAVIKLPPAYTNPTIPDTREEVATPEIVKSNANIAKYASHFRDLNTDAEVLILIGRDCGEAMKTRCYGNKAPWIHHTILGWAVVGNTCDNSIRKINRVLRTSIGHEHYKLKLGFAPKPSTDESLLKKNVFQEFSDDNTNSLSTEDEKFIKIMNEEVKVDADGGLVVPLPFKSDSSLPSNEEAVFHRTTNTLRRLKQSPEKMEQCVKSIQKSIDAGHIEVVPPQEQNVRTGAAWWIPIFPVVHPKKNKVRLVYDASAKYHGTSLNSKLLSGPDLNNKLRAVLLRFREKSIGFVADIEHMFNNFKVTENHKDFLRFYWFDSNHPDQKLIQYRSTSHIFGCTSSPAVANFCLRFTTRNISGMTSAKEYLQDSFYVDDGLSSANSIEEAVKILKDAREILSRYNIRLHKILSSSPEVLAAFPETERAEGCHDLKFEEIPSQRTLGILWSAKEDAFKIEVTPPDRKFTKRGVLSTINSLYDPLGFVAPISLAGRLIQRKILPPKAMRDPEIEACDWDDPLPEKYLPLWENWKASLSALTSIKIPRCYVTSSSQNPAKELHVFADASDEAIGFVIYMRSINAKDEIHVSFVTGGSKVAPQAAVSIPRLELCAAMEAALAASEVIKELKFNVSAVTYYSDSRVVLGYLFNDKRRFSKYVTRRIKIILSTTVRNQWKFVNGKDNPADLSSRPQTPNDLAKSCWLKGPKFLRKRVREEPMELLPTEDLPEVQQEYKTLLIKFIQVSEEITILCSRINNWIKVIRIITIILNLRVRFDYLKQNKGVSLAPRKLITSGNNAKLLLIKIAQEETYGEAITHLKGNKCLPESHKLSKLSPFIDNDSLLRVGGRLNQAAIPADNMHPILLPEKHVVTNLIIQHHHQEVKHQGRHLTLGSIRLEGYHVIHGSKVIRNFIEKCVACKKLRAETMTQIMSDLPKDRLEEVPPFTNTGIDVFGPYYIQEGRQTRNSKATKKIWVLICVCLVSRAIHLDILPAMDTSSLRNALSRFICIRGTCKIIRSDNGTNFLAARNQIKESSAINIQTIQEDLFQKNIEWIFNPPIASHCGGAWERKIGSVKKVMEGSMLLLGKRSLSRDEFSTMIQEAAAIVNNTPLWEVSSNPDDPTPLTPAALMTLKETATPPSPDEFSERDLLAYGKMRWRRVQYLADQFWIRWRRDYLQQLQVRNKWCNKRKSIGVGDVVLIRNKTEKRNKWPIARVIEIVKNNDGLVRSVRLKLPKSKSLYRSIHDLILLIDHSENQ